MLMKLLLDKIDTAACPDYKMLIGRFHFQRYNMPR